MTHRRYPPQLQAPRATRRVLLWAVLGLGALGLQVARAEGPPAFRIVVHPENPAAALNREFVTDVFLKRATRWPDGEAAHPVDQRADSSARKAFSDGVLRRSVSAVKRYWQQRIFSGRDLPPPEFDGDDAVVSYVLKHRGAIGYVSGSAKLGDAKAVSVQ